MEGLSILSSKEILRKKLIKQRLGLSDTEFHKFNENLLKQVSEFISSRNFQNIFLFYPMKGEPDLRNLIDIFENKISFFLPVIKEGRKMAFYPWNKKSSLSLNQYGILEPSERNKKEQIPDDNTLIIVPCVGIDKERIRLGMGGGYYDRYFSKHREGFKLGVCFPFAFVEKLPREAHDQKLDCCSTEL